MKKITLLFALIFTCIFNSCGPAAENREMMHIRAKGFQDSIANIIKTSMAEAAMPASGQTVVADTAKKMPAAGNPTTK